MKSLSKEQLISDWALSEAASPRWRKRYSNDFNENEFALLASAPTPNHVPPELMARVIKVVMTKRHALLTDYINGCAHFDYVEIPAEQLGKIVISPALSHRTIPVTLDQYIAGKYEESTWHDPRNAAKRLRQSTEKIACSGYPLLAPDKILGCDVLIEGYSRCIARILDFNEGKNPPPMMLVRCGI